MIVPLIQKEVQKLVSTDAPTFSGKPMREITDEWKRILEGIFVCLKQQKWDSFCPSPKQIKQITDNVQKAAKAAAISEAHAASTAAAPLAAQQAFSKATALAAASPKGSPAQTQAAAAAAAAARAMMEAEATYNQAQAAARDAKETLTKAQAAKDALWDVQQPTRIPFLLSVDNSTAHSLYEGSSKDKIVKIISPIQVLTVIYCDQLISNHCVAVAAFTHSLISSHTD